MPKRKKTRTHVQEDVAPTGATVYNEKTKGSVALSSTEDVIPKSIVAKGSKVIPVVNDLVKDIRRMMNPHTASKLKEKNSNRMKDYTAVAGLLGVSHVLVITQTKSNLILRIGRVPNGPTLHFKIKEYSLVKHVKALQKHPFESTDAFLTAPLVVLNNFNQVEESHVKLMRITFQNMFPSINVKTVKLSECRRVVLFHYNKEDGSVQMRHYAIKASPVGINKNIKKILQSKVPNLGHLQDISEFLENSNAGGNASDSEPDDDEGSKVVLSEKYNGKGNIRNQKSAMKLVELGPRMTLEMFKVEQGLGEGEVMYHKYQSKSADEAAALKSRIEKARLLKIERKAKQEANVKRKREEAEQKKQLKAEKKRQKLENKASKSGDSESDDDESDDDVVDDEDDLDDDNDDEISDDDEDDDEEDEEDDEEEEEDDE